MPSQATITGKIGPAEAVTALVIPNVKNANFNFENGTVEINGQTFDIYAQTTITLTVSGHNYTLSISA